MEEFYKAMAEDPDLFTKLQRKSELSEFIEKYHLTGKSSSLRCPVCNQYGFTGGSLRGHSDDPDCYTCRKCHLTFRLTCLEMPISELSDRLKKIWKEGTSIFDIAKEKEK